MAAAVYLQRADRQLLDMRKRRKTRAERWEALTRYVEDGRVKIGNNAAERALRTVALGRRNYLFAGSDASDLHNLLAALKRRGGESLTSFLNRLDAAVALAEEDGSCIDEING